MTHEEEQLKKIVDIKKMLDDGISKAEFLKSFENVIKVFLDAKKNLTDEHSVAVQSLIKLADKIADSNASDFSTFKKELSNVISKALKEQEDGMNFIRDKVRNLKDGHTPTHEEMMAEMPDTKKMIEEVLAKVPKKDTAEQIVEKINEADGTIERGRIEGLEDEIKSLRKEIATKSSGGVRRVYQPYLDDFSALTDGVTKTFYLSREPLKTNTVQIFCTDFPLILRPTTDFTIAGKTLLLTSAVPAPSTGATLIAHYHA